MTNLQRLFPEYYDASRGKHAYFFNHMINTKLRCLLWKRIGQMEHVIRCLLLEREIWSLNLESTRC